MMTFESLHKEIKDSCNCLDFGSKPNANDVFVRRGNDNPPVLDNFLSFFEEGKVRSGDRCKDYCHHRGVSMYQIDIDIPLKIEQLNESAQFKPNKKHRWRYIFRVRDEAGLIWYDESSEFGHCELFKCDQFSLENLEFIGVIEPA